MENVYPVVYPADSEVGPWEKYEYVVLGGIVVRVERPKWQRVFDFEDGGRFKVWVLDDRKSVMVFREKVGYWDSTRSKELPWDIQDRICFMVKNNEIVQIDLESPLLCIRPAVDFQVQVWLDAHPLEPLAAKEKEKYGPIQADRR